MSATIKFKAKVKQMYKADYTKTPAYKFVEVPQLKTSHCNMAEFRKHPKYGPYANSDLFLGILRKIRIGIVGEYTNVLNIEKLPDNVTINTEGFLAEVTVKV